MHILYIYIYIALYIEVCAYINFIHSSKYNHVIYYGCKRYIIILIMFYNIR